MKIALIVDKYEKLLGTLSDGDIRRGLLNNNLSLTDNRFYDMPILFEKLIKEELKSISFPIYEYWLDIGQIEEYHKANIEYREVF